MLRRNMLKLFSAAGSMTAARAADSKPMVLSTWDFGAAVTETAYRILQQGGTAIDAAEQGVRLPEADPKVRSVGFGGAPDREGKVTLDACIMDGNGSCGSVVFLEHILHPISVARLVMEKTPHVMLAGEGALRFALRNGFSKQNLLSAEAGKDYQTWKQSQNRHSPPTNKNNHDTIGLLALDGKGSMAGACSTSGLAYKMRGRVGDSPLIGAGLYVDNEVGGAAATGLGEAVIKVAGCFLVVELMRQGNTPAEACRLTIERILRKQKPTAKDDDFFVGFVALRKDGEIGALSYRRGLQYSLNVNGKNRVFDAPHYL